MSDIRIKRGSALQLTLAFANADGSAFDLTQVTLAGQLRDSRDDLVALLTVAPGQTPGVATIMAADTSAWPLGLLKGDILITAGGVPTLSQTFAVWVDRPVTQSLPDPPAPNPVLD